MPPICQVMCEMRDCIIQAQCSETMQMSNGDCSLQLGNINSCLKHRYVSLDEAYSRKDNGSLPLETTWSQQYSADFQFLSRWPYVQKLSKKEEL